MSAAPLDTLIVAIHDTVAVHDTTVVRDTVFHYLGRTPLPVPVKVDDAITLKDLFSWLVPAAVAALAAIWGAKMGADQTRKAANEATEREWQLERHLELTRLKTRVVNNLRRILTLCDEAIRVQAEIASNADTVIKFEIYEELEVLWNLYYRVAGPIFRLEDTTLASRIDAFFMEAHILAEEMKAFERYALEVRQSLSTSPGSAERTVLERQKWPQRRQELIGKVIDLQQRARDYLRELENIGTQERVEC